MARKSVRKGRRVSNGSKKTSEKFARSFFDTEHLEQSCGDNSAILERSDNEDYSEDDVEHVEDTCPITGLCICPRCRAIYDSYELPWSFDSDCEDEAEELETNRYAGEKSTRSFYGTEHLERSNGDDSDISE